MDDLLTHPAMQGGFYPFIVAAILAIVLRGRVPTIAVAAGLAVTAGLVLGWQLEPLTSTRKLVLVALVVAVAATGMRRVPPHRRNLSRAVVIGLVAICAPWVVLRVLQQMATGEAIVMAAAVVVFMATLLAGMSSGKSAAGNAVLAILLPWLVAVVALFGASAVLALITIATGAAALAHVLYGVVFRRRDFDPDFALPSAVVAGLAVAVSVTTGGVPAWVLVPVAIVPWCGRFLNRFDQS